MTLALVAEPGPLRASGGVLLVHGVRQQTPNRSIGERDPDSATTSFRLHSPDACVIILDEQLNDPEIIRRVKAWYPGSVLSVPELVEKGRVVKDDGLPPLLRSFKKPSFVTINVSDFWRRIDGDPAYCILCVDVRGTRAVEEVSTYVRWLLRDPEFSAKASRCGRVFLLRTAGFVFYSRVGETVYEERDWDARIAGERRE